MSLEQARALFESGDYATAYTVCQSDLRRADVFFLMAHCQLRLGKRDFARDLCKRALEKDPGRAEMWHDLGTLELDAGHLAAAHEAYQKAAELGMASSHEALRYLREVAPLDLVLTLDATARARPYWSFLLECAGQLLLGLQPDDRFSLWVTTPEAWNPNELVSPAQAQDALIWLADVRPGGPAVLPSWEPSGQEPWRRRQSVALVAGPMQAVGSLLTVTLDPAATASLQPHGAVLEVDPRGPGLQPVWEELLSALS